jgi:tetratricopeptide (TPR) repeat protein
MGRLMNRSVVLAVAAAALVAAAVLTWIGVRQQREFRRLIAAGDTALRDDQTFAAIEAFSGAIALKGDSMVAYLKRGDTYRHRGEYAAALRDLRHAAALDATATRPLELIGDVNAAMGRYDSAADAYRRFVALDDRAPRILYKLATAEFRGGHPDAAADALRRALAIDNRFAEAHYLLGVCLRATGRIDSAIRELTQAVTLDATLAAAREELAALYASLGRRRDEMDQLEALAALEPARPERLVAVALAYARSNRYDAALVTLGRAAERFPDSSLVATALGRIWLEVADERGDAGAAAKARATLEPVAMRTDASSEALALYGRALLRGGDVRAAERILQRATSRLPVDPDALDDLVSAARRLHHAPIAARADAERAALVRER